MVMGRVFLRALPLLGLLCIAGGANAEWLDLSLPTGGTLKANLALPAETAKAPAVIYMHGRTVREKGEAEAAADGYDVTAFSLAFADAGFVALSPIRQTPPAADNGDDAIDEGVAAILAAVEYLSAHPRVDARRIGVVGFGEGAVAVLWALSRLPDVAAGVVMSPASMDGARGAARTLAFAHFLDAGAVKSLQMPLLITVGEDEHRGARRRADALAQALIQSYKRFRYIHSYDADSRWFREPQAELIADIAAFLRAPQR